MAYAQWVSITITSRGTTLSLKNADLAYGKFHQTGNKDEEISPDDINEITINSGKSAVINSCGRENSPSGTEGRFDIFDGEVKVGEYYWDCPWGSKTNNSTWTPDDLDNYVTQVTGGSLDSGALGNITIKCVKL
jgi:hypothetical protein